METILEIEDGNTVNLAVLQDGVIDADADPINELQVLSLSGTQLSLTPNGGGAPIDLASSFIWQRNANNIFYNNGFVGIGTNTPNNRLEVLDPDLSATGGVIRGEYTGTTSTDGIGVVGISEPTDFYGLGGQFTGGWIGSRGFVNPTGNFSYYGLVGSVGGGSGSNSNYGLYGFASGGSVNYGVFAQVASDSSYAVYGEAPQEESYGGYFLANADNSTAGYFEATGDNSFAGDFVGIARAESDNFGATAGVVRGEYTGTTQTDGIGVVGTSVPVDFYGIGGRFTGGWRGVQGSVNPTGDAFYYGVYGSVSGGSGTNYGVYGTAFGSGTNYAGYFDGDARVTDNLEANTVTIGGTAGDRFNFLEMVS